MRKVLNNPPLIPPLNKGAWEPINQHMFRETSNTTPAHSDFIDASKTIPPSRYASHLPLHKGGKSARAEGAKEFTKR